MRGPQYKLHTDLTKVILDCNQTRSLGLDAEIANRHTVNLPLRYLGSIAWND